MFSRLLTFKEWRVWLKSLPIHFKLFVLIILFRPVIDNFYYLKNLSPLASPLYWVGVLTPVIAFIAIFSGNKIKSRTDRFFNAWIFLLFISSFFLIAASGIELSAIEFFLKLTAPFYVYTIFRRMIHSRTAFLGLLTTFLFSAYIAYVIIIYEEITGGINVSESRGLERYSGGFADVMNYAIYLLFGGLVIFYDFLTRQKSNKLLVLFGVLIIGLLNIKHTTSFIAFGILMMIFLRYIFLLKVKASNIIYAVGFISIVFALSYGTIQSTVDPLVEKEQEIIRGEREQSQMFHGRMSRWQWVWSEFKNSNIISQGFGYPLSGNSAYHMVGINVHNDFLRILFATGYLGIFFYILFLVAQFKKSISIRDRAIRFLGISNLALLFVYSMTTLPMFYASMLYPIMMIFAYFALPRESQ